MSTSFNEMIQKDLELLWAMQDYIRRTPWLERSMASIVSKHPWQDICAIIWLFFAFGIAEIGVKHFWVVMMNLSAAFCKYRIHALLLSEVFNRIVARSGQKTDICQTTS